MPSPVVTCNYGFVECTTRSVYMLIPGKRLLCVPLTMCSQPRYETKATKPLGDAAPVMSGLRAIVEGCSKIALVLHFSENNPLSRQLWYFMDVFSGWPETRIFFFLWASMPSCVHRTHYSSSMCETIQHIPRDQELQRNPAKIHTRRRTP